MENNKSICTNCRYIGPVHIPYDSTFRRYFCMKEEQIVTDYVTGTQFVGLGLCSDKNSDGNCPDFEPGESARLKYTVNPFKGEEQD